MNVLIIEPDHILAQTYAQAFNKAGIKTNICSGAQSAVTTIDKFKPDAVILELQLSGHSGVEFLHEFRSYEDWLAIPVFIHSSVPEYAFGKDPKTWDTLSITKYFYKPKTSLQQLVDAVKETIEKQDAA